MRKVLFSSVLAAFALLSVSGPAQAEETWDVTVEGTKVVVKTKGEWKVNKEYPWKLTIGNTKVDKKFAFPAEKVAELTDAPKGDGTVKFGVCSGDKCMTFEKAVSIK